MPDMPARKLHAHPREGVERNGTVGASPVIAYGELQVTSNFSFLRGASHPDELVVRAAELGYRAVALTDINTLAGIVRAHVAARSSGIQLVVGTRLAFEDGPDVLVYPTDREAYGRLCRLLTLGKRRAPKGECHLRLHDLIEYQEGMIAVVVPPDGFAAYRDEFLQTIEGLARTFDDDRLSLAATCLYEGDDASRLERLATMSEHLRVPMVATNDVHYHAPERRALQDVVACVRAGTTIERAGRRLLRHGERHLKEADEMARLFGAHPGAVARTVSIAQRCAGFSLDQIRYEYPEEVCPDGKSPMVYLRELTYRGAGERFSADGEGGERRLFEPGGAGHHRDTSRALIPYSVIERLEHELALIEELGYAKYFLTVYDIVEFARSRGILCQGRGAAANSAVCYCLGITAVDPTRVDMLFERFVSKERDEPPDIDIDFEHERREEVIQHIYRTYGRDRAALTAEVITYRGKSSIRDVGKAMGLSLDLVDRLSKQLEWWEGGTVKEERVREIGLDPGEPRLKRTLALAGELLGFPRHLSQHVGGFVITQGPLEEIVPIENAAMADRTVIEWDKDDVDAMGMLKIDCLGLGMLTCIAKSIEMVNSWTGSDYALHSFPPEDPEVYEMICHADTVGVFQIESRAQMSMLPRLKPRCYYDLVIEVAIVRPGPIQGKMVHPYLRRRDGQEEAWYPDERIERVLSRTLGVPLFQEQAMQLSIVAAGFTPGEADELRRAMAAWKRKGDLIHRFGVRIVKGMMERGYTREFADRCVEQIKGFGEYGFPESHAASFALLVYISSWLKRYHPAAFAASLINSQPMGFYAPAQIVRDAKEHGVVVLPVDVNRSGWDCSIEEAGERVEGPTRRPAFGEGGPALRLGLRLVDGVGEEEARRIEQSVRTRGGFGDIVGLWRASGVRVGTLRRLASADAFGSMGLSRREALWRIGSLRDERLPMFETDEGESGVSLPAMQEADQVLRDYETTGLTLREHPVSFVRELLGRAGASTSDALLDGVACPTGTALCVGGIVLLRQRPHTASGVVFMTLEDETGSANLVIWPRVYERYRRVARHNNCVVVWGKVERQGEVVHLVVRRMAGMEDVIGRPIALETRARNFH